MPTAKSRIAASLAACVAMLSALVPSTGEQTRKSALAPVDRINCVVGTQAIGGSYQFTKHAPLIEAAQVMRAMGSNVIKFVLTADPSDGPKPGSLVETARDARSVRTVLDMPFANYLMWVYPPSAEADRFHKASLPNEYREIYDLTCYLLKTYSGTGKTFYLGNWEGDWHLTHTNPNYTPTDEEVQNMIDWADTRQKAVDDAKRDTLHRNVEVYYYLEVNLVVDAMKNKVRLTNRVLPHVNVDFVSYSSYDSLGGDVETDLKRALDYIATQLPPKPSIAGKRVFVGEYGFPARNNTPQEQDRRSRQVMRACLSWGCRFCLYWELFNNEVEHDKQVGFWMIDDKNVKQPVYFTHQRFYAQAGKFNTAFIKAHRRIPTHAEFCQAAQAWLDDGKIPVSADGRN